MLLAIFLESLVFNNLATCHPYKHKHTPCPNVYTNGGICQGNTPFPACSPQTILDALTLFLGGNLFNGDLSTGKCRSYPDDVRRLWVELDGRKRFPLSELIPAQTCLHALFA